MRLFRRAEKVPTLNEVSAAAVEDASLLCEQFEEIMADTPHSLTQTLRLYELANLVDDCGFDATAQAMRDRISAPPARRTSAYNPCDMEKVTLVGGFTMQAHAAGTCAGYWCTIHYNSPHHMVQWSQAWDSQHQRMLRTCSHGVQHPDPDDLFVHDDAFLADHDYTCDGCCKRPFDLSAY